MRNKFFIAALLIICVLGAFRALPLATHAALDPKMLTDEMEGIRAGFDEEEEAGDLLPVRIGNIINVVLTILGIILVVLIVYAGFLWMTAGGETKNVDKAKDYIKNAVIGLAIILSAYAISAYVITKLVGAMATP